MSNAFSELAKPASSRGWRVEAYVRAVAGLMILAGVALTVSVSHWWLLLTAFVGLNLLQSAITGWCLMSNLLSMALPSRREDAAGV